MGSRKEKEKLVAEIKGKIESAKSVIFADYRGLTVKETTTLRAQLRKEGVELRVLKNTLGKIAADQAGVENIGQYLTGTTIWAFSIADPAAAAKVMKNYSKTNPKLILKGGILEKQGFDAKMAEAMADLPSREVLLGMVAGVMQAPLAGFVRVLQGPINKFGYALEDYRKIKEKSA